MSDHLEVSRETYVKILDCLRGLANLAFASRSILPVHMGDNFVNLVCKARAATDSIEIVKEELHGALRV